MKTKQEIMQMVNTCDVYYSCALCPYNPEDLSRYIGDKWKGGCPDCDRKLVYAMGKGYGDVSEYKAEIERLRQEVRDTDKMARNTIEQYKNNYDNAFERLKAQEREIDSLREDNIDLKEELYELHDDLNIARAKKDKTIKQAQIDLLNKVKEKLDNAPNGWAYTGYIDDLIEEVEK